LKGEHPAPLNEPSVRLRVAFLGPPGTFSEEALRAALPAGAEPVPLPTVYDAVMAVHEGTVDRALVPIENSLEGSVNATLDALAVETRDVEIVGEAVHAVRHCLIAARHLELDEIEAVVSHPQANGQCARFIRERLPNARVLSTTSTAEAVRTIAEARDSPWAALGTRLAAELYGCEILRAGVEDVADNETRFVWLAKKGTDPFRAPDPPGPWKTSLVFWGVGAQEPGWLVRCLSEFAFRGVNLTKIESRPRKQGLGRYMFFVDLEGRADDRPVAEAMRGLGTHCEEVRTLGSYPAA
jgi:prephenate dehydratase